jgi:N-acetylmuramoyl-L-alanine amidase
MILISAGHHPSMPGACYGGFCEHGEAVKWADRIVDILGDDKAMAVPVGALRGKIDFINRQRPSIAVEIHFNSAKIWKDKDRDGEIDPDELVHIGRGCETLYYPGSNSGKDAAIAVQELIAEIFAPDRGAKEGYYQMNKAKGPDFFLAKTRCTAIIIEPEFIDNKETITGNREAGCIAIAEALLSLLHN